MQNVDCSVRSTLGTLMSRTLLSGLGLVLGLMLELVLELELVLGLRLVLGLGLVPGVGLRLGLLLLLVGRMHWNVEHVKVDLPTHSTIHLSVRMLLSGA